MEPVMQGGNGVGEGLDDEMRGAQRLGDGIVEAEHFRVFADVSQALVGQADITALIVEEDHGAAAEQERSPDVEDGVGDFLGEGGGEERGGLVFGLELAAVGEGVAGGLDGAVGKEGVVGAGAERAGGFEGEGEFAREAGVAFLHGGEVAAIVADHDFEGGVGGGGGIGEGDAAVPREGFADLGGEDGLGLREAGFVLDGRDVNAGEGELGVGAEAVVRAAAEGENGQEEPEAGSEERRGGAHAEAREGAARGGGKRGFAREAGGAARAKKKRGPEAPRCSGQKKKKRFFFLAGVAPGGGGLPVALASTSASFCLARAATSESG